MTHPTLYFSSEDNKMHVFDMPEKPKYCEAYNADDRYCNSCFDYVKLSCAGKEIDYNEAVNQAIANKVLVKDQEQAKKIMWEQDSSINNPIPILFWWENKVKKDTPYPLSGYSVTIQHYIRDNDPCDQLVSVELYGAATAMGAYQGYKLAILTSVKEESKYLKDFKRTNKIIEKFWNRKVVKEEKKEDIKFDSYNKEKKYYKDKQQFLKYCLDIKFITKDQLNELDSLYDTLKGNGKPVESADNTTAFKEEVKSEREKVRLSMQDRISRIFESVNPCPECGKSIAVFDLNCNNPFHSVENYVTALKMIDKGFENGLMAIDRRKAETIIEPIYDWATEEEYFKLFITVKKVQEGLRKISISDNLSDVKYIVNDIIKMLSFTLDKVDEPTEGKGDLAKAIQKLLSEIFNAMENGGGREHYPLDSMTDENLIGMKRAYQHILFLMNSPRHE